MEKILIEKQKVIEITKQNLIEGKTKEYWNLCYLIDTTSKKIFKLESLECHSILLCVQGDSFSI